MRQIKLEKRKDNILLKKLKLMQKNAANSAIIVEEEGTETIYSYTEKMRGEKEKINEYIISVNKRLEELQKRINEEKVCLKEVRKVLKLREGENKLNQTQFIIQSKHLDNLKLKLKEKQETFIKKQSDKYWKVFQN